MIELEEQINFNKIEQIDQERLRKSSRLLKDVNSYSKIDPRLVDGERKGEVERRVNQSLNWKHQRYAELIKLLRQPQQKEREEDVACSLDYSHSKQDDMSTHFKGSWKAPLSSEIAIAPCR
jgi:hypothetical protein